jgi:hypothetical protein
MEAFWYRAWDDGVVKPGVGWTVQYFEDGQWKNVQNAFKVDGFDLPVYDYLIALDDNQGRAPHITLKPTGYDFVGSVVWSRDALVLGTNTAAVGSNYPFDLYAAADYSFTFMRKAGEINIAGVAENGKITAEMGNFTDSPASGSLIVAFYDSRGRLVEAQIKAFDDLAAGSVINFSTAIPAGFTGGVFKVFAWDKSYAPLCPAYTGIID